MESANELYREKRAGPRWCYRGEYRKDNPSVERSCGSHIRVFSQEVLGQSLDLIIPVELRKAHWEGFNRAISEGKTKSSGQAMITRSFAEDRK